MSGTLEVNCYTELAENGSKIACVDTASLNYTAGFALTALH